MPKFKYALKNGKHLIVEGDTQPDDSEVENLAREQGVELQPVETTIPEVDPVASANEFLSSTAPVINEAPRNENEGFLNRAWNAISEPLTEAPSRFADTIANYIDDPNAADRGYFKPLLAGAVEGIGDLASSMTSPIDLATTALTAGSGIAAKRGLGTIANLARRGAQATGIPMIAHGGSTVLDPETSLAEKGFGLAEMAGGAAPFLEMPSAIKKVDDIIPPTQNVIPEGVVLPPEMMTSVDDFNARIPKEAPPKSTEEAAFEIARQRQNMGMEIPQSADPTIGFGVVSKPFDPNTLKDLVRTEPVGFPASQVPDAAPKPEKPKYRLDWDSGAYVPIDANGNQVGPAVMPGKELDPEIASNSKYTTHTGDPRTHKESSTIKTKVPAGVPTEKVSVWQKAYDLPRGLMSVDPPFMTSAAFRQGGPLVGTKAWFKAWAPSIKSYGSEAIYQKTMHDISKRPLFVKSVNGESFADKAGLFLNDLSSFTRREEALRGQLAEKVPGYGKLVRGSNRAYSAFLNELRASRFETLVDAARESGIDIDNNLDAAKAIATAVNELTGRGSLGKAEKHAALLTNIFFSPRNTMSKIRLISRQMNPKTYTMLPKGTRLEYMKGLLRQSATWWGIAGLAQYAGAQVSKDPTNADFGKIKIGNTRIDPAGGLQQFLVLGSRIASGGTTSSTKENAKFKPFGTMPFPQTPASIAQDFTENRLHPAAKFGWDLANATKDEPFRPLDRIAQLAIPMYTQDLIEVIKENPELTPMTMGKVLGTTVSAGLGGGTQTYDEKSFTKPTVVPEEFDAEFYR
jgi:hypothetical protein